VTTTLTYQALLTEAREILQDVNTDPTLQRYPDQTLVSIFNRGLQELYRLRPDAFYDFWDPPASDFDVPTIVITAQTGGVLWTSVFELPMMFYDPLVNWVIGTVEAIDDEFSEDARSTAFRAFFKQQVVGL
jgi:hypothetical protein